MQVIISQCIVCAVKYACNIDGVRTKCSECKIDCVINSEDYEISHGYCNFDLAIHMRKFQPNRLSHEQSNNTLPKVQRNKIL